MGVENIENEIGNNTILKEVKQLLINQTAKGLEKYGHSVEPAALTTTEWLTHMQEEMLDGLIYATIAKSKINELMVKARAFDEINSSSSYVDFKKTPRQSGKMSKRYFSNHVKTVDGIKVINGTTLYQCAYRCSCGDVGKRFVKEDVSVTSCHKCKQKLIIEPASENDAHDEQFNYFMAYQK